MLKHDEDIANFVDEPHVQPEVVVDDGPTNDNVVEKPPVVEPIVEGSSRIGRFKRTIKRGGPGYKRNKVPTGRFNKLGRWFGIGQDDVDSDPISDSEEANHNAGTFFPIKISIITANDCIVFLTYCMYMLFFSHAREHQLVYKSM